MQPPYSPGPLGTPPPGTAPPYAPPTSPASPYGQGPPPGSYGATAPTYGGPPPKQGMGTLAKVLIALGVVGLLGAGGCVVCVAVISKGVNDAQQEAQQARKNAASITATKLLNDYKVNEVKADADYKGKYFKVSGKLGDVKRDVAENPFLTVGTGAPFELQTVQCMIDTALEPKAAALKKGAAITVTGRVDGKPFNVLVRDCRF